MFIGELGANQHPFAAPGPADLAIMAKNAARAVNRIIEEDKKRPVRLHDHEDLAQRREALLEFAEEIERAEKAPAEIRIDVFEIDLRALAAGLKGATKQEAPTDAEAQAQAEPAAEAAHREPTSVADAAFKGLVMKIVAEFHQNGNRTLEYIDSVFDDILKELGEKPAQS